MKIPSVLNVTNFVDDGGGAELFKYVDLGMRDKMRATLNKPEIIGMATYRVIILRGNNLPLAWFWHFWQLVGRNCSYVYRATILCGNNLPLT